MERKQERRVSRRLGLSLPVTRIRFTQGEESTGQTGGWTRDLSATGMFVHLNDPQSHPVGTDVEFEMTVPPGEGYSLSTGKISGTGTVVRMESANDHPAAGMAVQFNKELDLLF